MGNECNVCERAEANTLRANKKLVEDSAQPAEPTPA